MARVLGKLAKSAKVMSWHQNSFLKSSNFLLGVLFSFSQLLFLYFLFVRTGE